jgi:type IV pilus assembly protein PilC
MEAGSSFAQALSRHPRSFDSMCISVIRAGESAGALAPALEKTAQFMEARRTLRKRILLSLIHPILMVAISTAIAMFILVFITPRLVQVFVDLGAKLPGPTIIFINLYDVVFREAGWLLAAAVLSVLACHWARRTERGRYFIDRLKLHIPGFGPILRRTSVARYVEILATLVKAGVPVPAAFEYARGTEGNVAVARFIDRVYTSMGNGDTIQQTLAASPAFPPVVHNLLDKLSETCHQEVEDALRALPRVMRALVILYLGMILLALYLPLFQIMIH